MPEGQGTVVGERGKQLSAGERQRLALAVHGLGECSRVGLPGVGIDADCADGHSHGSNAPF